MRDSKSLAQRARMPGLRAVAPFLPATAFAGMLLILGLLLHTSWRDATRHFTLRQAQEARLATLEGVDRAGLTIALNRMRYELTEDAAHLALARETLTEMQSLLARLDPPVMAEFAAQAERIAALRASADALRDTSFSASTVAVGQGPGAAGPLPLVDAFSATLTASIIGERAIGATIAGWSHAEQQRYYDVLLALGATVLTMLATLIVASRRAAARDARREMMKALRVERDAARLLGAELRHRVQNLFSIVSAIVSQTGRAECDGPTAAAKIGARIAAVAKAQALTLRDGEWTRARPDELARAICAAYAPAPDRLTIRGTHDKLSAGLITSLGLILNELCTNALKHGAWRIGAGTGRVDLALSTTPAGGLALDWTETGADLPARTGLNGGAANGTAEGHTGFGSRLNASLLAQHDATQSAQWSQGGLHLRLRFAPDMAAARDGFAASDAP